MRCVAKTDCSLGTIWYRLRSCRIALTRNTNTKNSSSRSPKTQTQTTACCSHQQLKQIEQLVILSDTPLIPASPITLTRNSNTKISSSFSLITSLSLTMQGAPPLASSFPRPHVSSPHPAGPCFSQLTQLPSPETQAGTTAPRSHQKLKYKEQLVVLPDDLLQLDDAGVAELAQRLDLPQRHALLPRVKLAFHLLDRHLSK